MLKFLQGSCCYKIYELLPVFIYLLDTEIGVPGDVFLVLVDIYPSKNGASCSHLLQVEVDFIVCEFLTSSEGR